MVGACNSHQVLTSTVRHRFLSLTLRSCVDPAARYTRNRIKNGVVVLFSQMLKLRDAGTIMKLNLPTSSFVFVTNILKYEEMHSRLVHYIHIVL